LFPRDSVKSHSSRFDPLPFDELLYSRLFSLDRPHCFSAQASVPSCFFFVFSPASVSLEVKSSLEKFSVLLFFGEPLLFVRPHTTSF